MFIDSHCHLQLKEYDQDRTLLIGNAKKAGVKKCIVPGDDIESSQKAIELSIQYPNFIYPSIGFHPYEAEKNPDISILRSIIRPSVVAIGECGLDYHLYTHESAMGKKYRQQKLFEQQLLYALEVHLPVIIHCRDAFTDIWNVIDSLPSIPHGVIHCFSSGLEDIRQAEKRNLFIGIDGNITYSRHIQLIAPSIPLHMLLLETDSPYLTPAPFRSTRNEPKHLRIIAQTIAQVSHLSVDTIEEQTTLHAEALFALSDENPVPKPGKGSK